MRAAKAHSVIPLPHIMAQAIKRLFPEVKLAIGPSIEDGFYYDIDSDEPITAEDLPKIEAEMKKIRKRKPGDHQIYKTESRGH